MSLKLTATISQESPYSVRIPEGLIPKSVKIGTTELGFIDGDTVPSQDTVVVHDKKGEKLIFAARYANKSVDIEVVYNPVRQELANTERDKFGKQSLWLTTTLIGTLFALMIILLVQLDKISLSSTDHVRSIISGSFVFITLFLLANAGVRAMGPMEDKAFDRISRLLQIPMGVVATVVGFYFAQPTSNKSLDAPVSTIAPPANLTGSVSGKTVTLSWGRIAPEDVKRIDGIAIRRKVADGSWENITSAERYDTEIVLANQPIDISGTEYQIITFKDDQESKPSNTVGIKGSNL
ncbi:MAG: hypothetical protein SFY68_13365 [Candidatus Sumerlaeia bacterium]|nr:hypothetical protein [Candidatus Sumerlaeia bacterium]